MRPGTRSDLLVELEMLENELEWRKCAGDWYYWLDRYVYTKDENDKQKPFKKFLDGRDLPYIALVGELYLTERRLIILKSRQLGITWLLCALDLWECMFQAGRFVPITAYKEGDAADILDRIKFIYEGVPGDERAPGLPMWMRDRLNVRFLREPFEMQFRANGSLIRAVPEGAENLRGKTISRWKNEESRSQPRLEQTAQSVLPAVQGAAQAVFVSSAGQGYFQRLVEDKLEASDPPPMEEMETGLEGVRLWKNQRNKYVVVRIHYTADPVKRDPRWIVEATAGMPPYQVEMEYEINFGASSGLPAIPIFDQRRMEIVIQPFDIPEHWPRFDFADYGTTNPYCCLFGAVGPDKELYVYWEYYAPGPLGMHLAVIKAQPDFKASRQEAYILDRSCWAQTQQASSTVDGQTLHSMRSVADLHQDEGVYPIPAHVVGDTVKVNAFYREWGTPVLNEEGKPVVGDDGKIVMTRPRVFIFSTCVNLIRELPGIKWAQKKLSAELSNDPERLVDRDNHAFDALSYGILYHRQGASVAKKATVSVRWDQAQKLAQLAKMAADEERVDRGEMMVDVYDGAGDDEGSGGSDSWGLD